jgi:hypothetical protein
MRMEVQEGLYGLVYEDQEHERSTRDRKCVWEWIGVRRIVIRVFLKLPRSRLRMVRVGGVSTCGTRAKMLPTFLPGKYIEAGRVRLSTAAAVRATE